MTFFKFCPNYIFGIGKARHFKFRMLIDTQGTRCMRNILSPKGIIYYRIMFSYDFLVVIGLLGNRV